MPETWQKEFRRVSGAIIGLLILAVAGLAYGLVTDNKELTREQGGRIDVIERKQIGYDKDFEFMKASLKRIEATVIEIREKQ